ncbi:MAG: PKD domain-containing protein [Ferruginibacter sp.]
MKLSAAKRYSLLYFVITIFFLLSVNMVSAQLQANFTVDKTGGCSPLNVKFTNTTTGASGAVTWQWNFGNTNTSTLKDPGATYFTEKTYTVTLTAKDGATTSTKTIDITVYKKPTVDFTLAPIKGCAPLNVNFTANATPGDGTLTNYLWDFGDGITQQGSNFNAINHTYTFPQNPPVTLNVTNSYGCYTTLTKNNVVEVVKAVQASFTNSTNSLCNAGESVIFTNTSTGSGTLTYKWDFGDGKTSTQQSPVHVYDTNGAFYTTLTVSSSDGCSATFKSGLINVANFVADFSVPAVICLNQYFTLTNKSTALYDKLEWWIDNNFYSNNFYSDDLYTLLNTVGDHNIKLIAYYGNCSIAITKKITVKDVLNTTDFIADLQGACGIPVTIKYKDTTTGAVGWTWQNYYYNNNNTFATTQNASYTYTSGSYEIVHLTVKNAAGCSTTISKFVNYEKPNINIQLTNTTGGYYQGCTGLTLSFAASPDTAIQDYKWNFGDATAVSTLSNPTHTFSKAGIFNVTLDYTTKNGCKGTANYNYVTVVDKPAFDFAVQNGTTVCGNTPTTFVATPAASGWSYNWTFNDVYSYGNYGNSTVTNKFTYDTTYTVMMVATNSGCIDTVIKKDYIKVLPPFPHISQQLNTCDDTRGTMRFTEDSKKALQWSWNFGDGVTDTYSSVKDTIRHTYTATGSYKVVLSTTNGACTVKDSVTAYVLLKQHPLLTSAKTDACGSDVVNFTLSGLEINTNPYSYYYSYNLYGPQYGDLTTSNTYLSTPNIYWQQSVSGTIQSLDPGKNDIRLFTQSSYFNCLDTSNFIPIKIHGPKAGFKVLPHSGCFKDPVIFTDTSHYFGNSKIVKWEWNFDDGKTQTLLSGGSTSHTYSAPGYYYVQLTVTDADGCTSLSNYYDHYVSVDGPKADFNASSYNVAPNTTVYLNNTSLFYNYYYYNTLQWIFPDSTTSTIDNTSFTFTNEGTYPVKLITQNSRTGCNDTIVKNITVRKVNSAFTYKFAYINNNACPPVIATFTSISTNAVRLAWDFGDGGVAGDQPIVSHTYNKPGLYRVVHYSYDSNNGVDSTEDFIEVKGPYALLQADVLTGCNKLTVKLTAEVKYANDYTWDFGDGTVIPTTDTFAVHTYLTPGIYVPSLILRDNGGCSATSELPEKVIVDSLYGGIKISPSIICDSALSIFTSQVESLSNNQIQSPINYTWIVYEANKMDTIQNLSASHFFNSLGAHLVALEVSTPYGCTQRVVDSVLVKQGVTAMINGPAKLCKGDIASFTGSATTANSTLQWNWNFGNGNISTLQNPLPQQFNSVGSQQISLMVSNGGCSDTALYPIVVNGIPVVSFSNTSPFVCKGDSVRLTASGGASYLWNSGVAITNSNSSSISSKPSSSIYYFVKITDVQGCSNKDSVFVKVVDPQKLVLPSASFACQGSPVQLTASGTDQYKWINNVSGISDVNISNPLVLPNTSTTYTVVGYDNYNCFTDTASIAIRISPLPVVDAGIGSLLISGASFMLNPKVSGANSYTWSPPDYLNCTACLSPVSTPKNSITYTITAANADGCKASDTVSLRIACANNLVFIPKAFSPNNDNLNDRFTVTGSGIKQIRSIVIYSRWGKLIFERKNVQINDRTNSWDGYFKGEPMPAGAYVYQIQTECDGGEIFDFRGNVVLLR